MVNSMRGYVRAEDLFAAARDASRERMSALRQIEILESKRGISSPGMGRGYSSLDANRVSGTLDLLEYRRIMDSRIESDERLLSYATEVLYGADGRGGVAALLSSRHADAVFWRYLSAEPWKTCSACLGEPEPTLKRMCREVFELCDSLGFDRVIAGKGAACE